MYTYIFLGKPITRHGRIELHEIVSTTKGSGFPQTCLIEEEINTKVRVLDNGLISDSKASNT